MMKKISLIFWNSLPAAFFGFVTVSKILTLNQTSGYLKITQWLVLIQMGMIAFFFMIRRPPNDISWRPLDVTMSILATAAPFLFSFANPVYSFRFWGAAIQFLGTVFTFFSMLSLGRSFGVLPANRGIQARGMYRFVRHPLYFSYAVANFGYWINYPGLYNLCVIALAFLSQIARIFSEEKVLDRDTQYMLYKRRVRWRLIPFLF